MWEFETACNASPVAGIDEAGRGPWAGPVVASAVILHPGNIPDGINDSKQLSKLKRDALFDAICATAHTGVGIASVEEIDELNILQATFLAMQRAVDALPIPPAYALVDGNRLPKLPCPAQAIIEGDARSLSIGAASIIAKVTRDRIMEELAAEYPAYGWDKNAGYGTKMHQNALKNHGVTAYHRRSFKPIRLLLEREEEAA